MKSVVLNAGALIALERGDRLVAGYVALADDGHVSLLASSAVIAQVWRGGARQTRLARLLSSDLVMEVPLDSFASRRIGLVAAAAGASDVVDGHVAVIAHEHDAIVVTSDPDDIARWGVTPDRIVRC